MANTVGTELRSQRQPNTTKKAEGFIDNLSPSRKTYTRDSTPPNTKLAETMAYGYSKKPKGGLSHQNHL
jgi:hypothetical protein